MRKRRVDYMRWIWEEIDDSREAERLLDSAPSSLKPFLARDAGEPDAFSSYMALPERGGGTDGSVTGDFIDEVMSSLSAERQGRDARCDQRRNQQHTQQHAAPLFRALPVAAAFVIGFFLAAVLFRNSNNMDARSDSVPVVTVQFELVAPEATSVTLVGDFNAWDRTAHPLRYSEETGLWSVQVELVEGEIYTYNFLVDGEVWMTDPSAADRIEDSFGVPKSVMYL